MTLQFDLDFPWKNTDKVILLNISFWFLHRELEVNRDDERERKTGAEKSGSGTSDIFVNISVP